MPRLSMRRRAAITPDRPPPHAAQPASEATAGDPLHDSRRRRVGDAAALAAAAVAAAARAVDEQAAALRAEYETNATGWDSGQASGAAFQPDSALMADIRTALGRLEATGAGLHQLAALAAGSEPAALVDPQVAVAMIDAQELERARLAAELHDGPAQGLANAIFQAQVVERALRSGDDEAAAELAALRSSLQRELDALRGYVNQLRPDVASGEAFDQAIAEAAAVLRRLGLAVDLRMTASGELLPEAARAAVVRICQEALRNVGRHASASRAWISTDLLPSDARRPARWRIEIGDDGRGFERADVERRGSRHFGLRFMRERAGQVHADLAIDSRPGQGTVVHLVVPLGQQQLEVS